MRRRLRNRVLGVAMAGSLALVGVGCTANGGGGTSPGQQEGDDTGGVGDVGGTGGDTGDAGGTDGAGDLGDTGGDTGTGTGTGTEDTSTDS
jgi:hypothetical protein